MLSSPLTGLLVLVGAEMLLSFFAASSFAPVSSWLFFDSMEFSVLEADARGDAGVGADADTDTDTDTDTDEDVDVIAVDAVDSGFAACTLDSRVGPTRFSAVSRLGFR